MLRLGWPALLIGLLLLLSAAACLDWFLAEAPQAWQQAVYVGRQACVECHEQQHQAWRGSHHDLAMQLATEETVLGDFSDVAFEHLGVQTRFFRSGEQFMVRTEGPDGEPHDYAIKYTFGCDPLQQYMVEFADGRVQVLRVSWDVAKQQWFYVPAPDAKGQRLTAGDPLHWTGVSQNWNTMCASCHATKVEKGYDLATDSYQTRFAEMDVSCEACHGPGSLHVKLAQSASLFWDRRHGRGIESLNSMDNVTQVEACAQCHARRAEVHPDFRPGSPLLDSYQPALLQPSLYHADGQILDEVFVHGSFLQSKMFHKGVRCTDCHDPHSLQLKYQGNALCGQCHVPATYDTPAHHHHQPGQAGASCVECHMPARTYMEIDARRDHAIRMPRPDLTVSHGFPNACNNCHVKPAEDAQWAADKVVEWYGPQRKEDPHWGVAFAAARAGLPEGQPLLIDLCRRLTTPSIVEATALELLANYPGIETIQAGEAGLASFDPQVRLSAVRLLATLGGEGAFERVVPHLADPIRAVRIETARQLASADPTQFDPNNWQLLQAGLAEFRQQQAMGSDHAASHVQLAQLSIAEGKPKQAMASLRQAIRLEPYLTGPRSLLAVLLSEQGAKPQEVQTLQHAEVQLLQRELQQQPENASTWFELGRIQVLSQDTTGAVVSLRKVVALAPHHTQGQLMLSLALERQYQATGDAALLDEAVELVNQLKTQLPQDAQVQLLLKRLLQLQGERQK